MLAMEHQLKLQQTRCLQRATWFFESPLKSWGPLSTSGEFLRWCPCLFLSTEFRSCNIRPKKSGVVQMCLFSRLYNSYTCFASICQVYQIQRHQHCCKSKAAARLDHSKHSLSAHDDHDVTDSEPLHWFWGSGGFQ